MSAVGIRLLREPLSHDAAGHVLRLPRWVAPDNPDGYWHIPRSAETRGNDFGLVRFWCGPHRFVMLSRLTNKTPPSMRCGTCEGRAAGYEQANGAIYRPRTPFMLPPLCPATGGPSDRCWLCGRRRSFRRDAGGYYEVRHKRGEGLAEVQPCPRHGWRQLSGQDGVLRCYEWRCTFQESATKVQRTPENDTAAPIGTAGK